MRDSVRGVLGSAVLALALTVIGCGESGSEKSPAPPAKPGGAVESPKAPLVNAPKAADWCKEHMVPESVCTRCNKDLIADFKKKGDWCAKHDLPESQCTKCHPDLEAKFKAMAPKE